MAGLVAISGGGSGIGLAVAEAVLAAGGEVALADRDQIALARAAMTLNGPQTRTRALDVTHEDAVMSWFESLDGLSGAVCCAGISAATPTLETPASLFRNILEVNVTGSFLVAQAAARRMQREGRGGSLVLVASVSGLSGMQDRVAYSASKAAVVNMAAAMAVDLAPHGIRVNAICPGPIETPMVRVLHDAATRAAWAARIPQRRYGHPEEVAQMALFLLDPARSGYVTGQAIAVDGGFSTAGLMP
ncbi:MAG: SDR family oxidoreductase [Rubritepida sp.]|jgi:NAD(P)-dependent dehydrogenase (short-subunit alcohol dehydrogenase family)|nr:SDR family oxidoreductase [Rubritepida sp.]MCU0944587.1 SDR family oxidoreductase [Rubritepida sp.]